MSSSNAQRLRTLTEEARAELTSRWSVGDPVRLDEYLTRFPELRQPDALTTLAWQEYCLRRRAGEPATRNEYGARFAIDVSQWPDSDFGGNPENSRTFRIDVHPASPETESILAASPGTTNHPSILRPGDSFLGFRIVRELGRGTFGCVYLAHQEELSERPVALKISTELLGEVRKLARLQHTNIVPVYSIHRSESHQALCMPYMGCTTLAHVISHLRDCEQYPVNGQAIIQSIESMRSRIATNHDTQPLPSPDHSQTLPTTTIQIKLGSMSYIDAILWIGSQLADGLAHAHHRGLIHRDIKPGNILLTDDGIPMLLDFNLADDRNLPRGQRGRFAGTLPFMSPEQLASFVHDSTTIDHRTDIYSLGLILYQLLTRHYPFSHRSGAPRESVAELLVERQQWVPDPRSQMSELSPAVAAIVQKCLQADPNHRYQSATELKEDLDRQLSHRPLKHLREPSLAERFQKWCRRNERLLSPASILAILSVLILSCLTMLMRSVLESRSREHSVQVREARTTFEAFLENVERTKITAVGEPHQQTIAFQLGKQAMEPYLVAGPDWKSHFRVRLLPENDQHRLIHEMQELAFIVGQLQSKEPVPQSAVPRMVHSGLFGDPNPINVDLEKGPRAAYLQAFRLASQGHYREALPLIRTHLVDHSQDFGAWYLKARCHEQLDQDEDGLAAYGTCLSIRPRFAQGYAARAALLLRQRKHPEEARADLDRALEIQPNFFEARLNRAIVLQALKKYDLALQDLDILLESEQVPSRVWFIRAMVRDAAGDREGATADRERGFRTDPTDAVSFLARGMNLVKSDPEQALRDFHRAETLSPGAIEPLLNQAWLLGEHLQRNEEALEVFDRVLKMRPDNIPARSGRAILLARKGYIDEAVAEARRCLEQTTQPSIHYQAGCVFALASRSDPTYRVEAVKHLAIALFNGFGHQMIYTDRDLKSLWQDPTFRRLLDSLKLLRSEPR